MMPKDQGLLVEGTGCGVEEAVGLVEGAIVGVAVGVAEQAERKEPSDVTRTSDITSNRFLNPVIPVFLLLYYKYWNISLRNN